MTLISLNEAVEIVPVSKATLYRNASDGKFRTRKNAQHKLVVEVAELERFYGKLNMPTNGKPQETATDSDELVALLKDQLAKAEVREEKMRQMLKREQEKTLKLMFPASEPEPEE